MEAAPPDYHPDPPLEEEVRIAFQALDAVFAERTKAQNRGDHAQVPLIEERIAQAMRHVGDTFPAGDIRRTWYSHAEQFRRANREEMEHILMPIAKGIGLLIVVPLALVGLIVVGVLDAVGTVLYGAGKVVQGLGSLLTGGRLR